MKTETQNVESTEEVTEPEAPATDLSPIEVAKLAGVRPQMVYNYIKAGYIEAERNTDGKLRITVEEAARWVAKYTESKAARAEAKQAKLEAELEGADA